MFEKFLWLVCTSEVKWRISIVGFMEQMDADNNEAEREQNTEPSEMRDGQECATDKRKPH